MYTPRERRIIAPAKRARAVERDEPADPAAWARLRLGLDPDPLQTAVLRSESKRVLLNCCRQWGKSTVTAAKAVQQAYRKAESLTLVVSPSARQSSEFMRKANAFVRRLGIRPKGDGDNDMSVALPNGSRIVGLPGQESTIRGFSAVSLLLVDEASRVDDDLYMAIRPMLAVSGGTLWLMSTPWGKKGFFYDAWANGGARWERFKAPGPECPRIDPEFLEEERRTMGEHIFRQEYLCEFDDAVSGVFDRDTIDKAITTDVKPLDIW